MSDMAPATVQVFLNEYSPNFWKWHSSWNVFLSTSPRTGFQNLKLKHQLRYRSNTICRTLMFLMELGQRCQKREHRQIIYNWCLKRARCRKYSTINVSKFLPASSCSRRLSRNQIKCISIEIWSICMCCISPDHMFSSLFSRIRSQRAGALQWRYDQFAHFSLVI